MVNGSGVVWSGVEWRVKWTLSAGTCGHDFEPCMGLGQDSACKSETFADTLY